MKPEKNFVSAHTVSMAVTPAQKELLELIDFLEEDNPANQIKKILFTATYLTDECVEFDKTTSLHVLMIQEAIEKITKEKLTLNC